MTLPSNHHQIDLLLKGDEATIRLLYDTLFPKFASYVSKNSGTYSDAEEIFHKALYQIIARAKTSGVEIKTSFEAYFFTVCKNLWLKDLIKRKKEVRNEGVIELRGDHDDHTEDIIHQERWELFEEMFEKLSENCNQLLKDYFKKVPYSEIVKKFNYSSENTAFQRIFKCKRKLKELIKADQRFKRLYMS